MEFFQTAGSNSRQSCLMRLILGFLRLLQGNGIKRPRRRREGRSHVPAEHELRR